MSKLVENPYSFFAIAGICGVVLLIVLLKRRGQALLYFGVRMGLGAIGFSVVNKFLAAHDIMAAVGINPISLLTVGILGFSGFVLLYGISFCKFL